MFLLHLIIRIEGCLWKTVFWEQPILAIVSELAHNMNGDFDEYIIKNEYNKSYNKCKRLIDAKVNFQLVLLNGIKIKEYLQ